MTKTSFILAFVRRIPGKSAYHIARSLGFSSALVSSTLYRLTQDNRVSRQQQAERPGVQSWRYYA